MQNRFKLPQSKLFKLLQQRLFSLQFIKKYLLQPRKLRLNRLLKYKPNIKKLMLHHSQLQKQLMLLSLMIKKLKKPQLKKLRLQSSQSLKKNQRLSNQ